MQHITALIDKVPIGYSEVLYNNARYSLTRQVFNQGKSDKIFAQELGGNNFISLNFYRLKNSVQLKPCEMPNEKVIHFLSHYITPTSE